MDINFKCEKCLAFGSVPVLPADSLYVVIERIRTAHNLAVKSTCAVTPCVGRITMSIGT